MFPFWLRTIRNFDVFRKSADFSSFQSIPSASTVVWVNADRLIWMYLVGNMLHVPNAWMHSHCSTSIENVGNFLTPITPISNVSVRKTICHVCECMRCLKYYTQFWVIIWMPFALKNPQQHTYSGKLVRINEIAVTFNRLLVKCVYRLNRVYTRHLQ